MWPRRPLSALILATFSPLGAGAASGQEPPFGLAWGPVTDVPRPSLVIREGNVTALIYLSDRVPAAVADTEEIVLEVCAAEGLQRLVWISRLLPASEAQAKYVAALAEGTRCYGPPFTDPVSGEVVWWVGRTSLAWSQAEANLRGFTMTAHGPDLGTCSARHQKMTGHPVTEHRFEAHPPP